MSQLVTVRRSGVLAAAVLAIALWAAGASPGYASTVEMDSKDNAVCRTCHGGGTRATWNSLHQVVVSPESNQNPHFYLCYPCHGQSYLSGTPTNIKMGCVCHYFTSPAFKIPYMAGQSHGGTATYIWDSRTNPAVWKVAPVRGEFDCIYCHQEPIGTERTRSYWPSSSRHDFVLDHTIQVDPGCVAAACHTTSLTQEHARPGRTDASGASMRCMSCHGSADPKVKAAITTYPAATLSGIPPSFAQTSTVYQVPGKSITGATLRTRLGGAALTLRAFQGSTWTTVTTMPATANQTRVVTFAPASKIEFALQLTGSYQRSATMNKIKVTPLDPAVTCWTCHDTHPHPDPDLSVLANGERPCSDCHSASLGTEHTKTTSSSAAAGCDACHDSGGAREQAGEWDGTCAAVGCHAAGGARPVHEVYCLGCHGVGQQDFAQSAVDFSMPAVDRATACVRCHWRPKHFSHGSTVQCNRCHYSLPTRTDFYFSTVSTAFGQFSSAGSALAGPRQLHAIHTNGSWPQTVKKNPATGGGTTDCASCHAPAACEACHDGGAAHGAHTAGAYPGPSYRATSGKPVASTASDTTFAYTPTCASDSCHSLSATVRTIRTAREQNDPAISYADRWSVLTASQGSGGSLTWTARAGARATYSFEGPGRVTLIGLRNPFGGYATVTLDGAVVDTVDCYSPGTDYGSALYSSPWLGEGTHTIELTATGTRRASSSGAKVYLDRIDTFQDDPGADRFVPACSSCHEERKVDHSL